MSEEADTVKADRKAMRQRVLRRQRDARIRFWRLFAVVSFFAVAIGANLYVGATVLLGNMRGPVVVEKSVPGDGRTARVRRPLLDGTFCRDIIFDNQTSESVEDKVERCDKSVPPPRRRNRSQFSWGNR